MQIWKNCIADILYYEESAADINDEGYIVRLSDDSIEVAYDDDEGAVCYRGKNKGSRKVCVVGYAFSWESRHAPHFTDIRKGVWSTLSEKSKINPFTSVRDYCVVMNWFNCRRQVITASNRVYKDSDSFQMLREMQGDLDLTIATQCEDGLMNLNGIENVYELYGNVFQAICYENGHEFPSWPAHEEISQLVACKTCGSAVFPNVEMFGWNQKSAVRKGLLDQIEESEALILIGADKNLSPFIEANGERFKQLPIIYLLEDGIVLEEKKSAYKASTNEIEKHIWGRITTSAEWPSKRNAGYQGAMSYLRQIHEIYSS